MVKVEVKNFQSISVESVDIEGFSVVVGRSNVGKSALVRAVKAALTGAPADSYVRHLSDCQRAVKGSKTCKCSCSVHIVSAGFDLLWEKGDAVNRYVFNGVEHSVVGRGTPEFLGPELAPVHIGGDSTPTLLQVADQFRPLFILDRSGTAIADVLSDVAKLDQINAAARAVERDKRECAATRKVREKDLKELDRTLEQYDGLDAVLARVAEVERLQDGVATLEHRKQVLERYVVLLSTVTSALRLLHGVDKIEVPVLEPLVERAQRLRSLYRWQQILAAKIQSSKELESVARVTVPEISATKRLSGEYGKLVRWVSQLTTIKGAFARLRAAHEAAVPDVAGLATQFARLQTVATWAARLGTLETAIALSRRALAEAEEIEVAILAEFKTLEVCPTCRQPLTVSHTHLGAA